jgi:hypothetical protein
VQEFNTEAKVWLQLLSNFLPECQFSGCPHSLPSDTVFDAFNCSSAFWTEQTLPGYAGPMQFQATSRIYVAGHRGLVGSAIWRELEKRGFKNLIGRTHAELNLLDSIAVEKLVSAVT